MSDSMTRPWVDGLTIGQVLQQTAARVPQQEAFVFCESGERLSWRDFLHETGLVSRALIDLGLKAGDHLAVWATNVPQWVLLQFAAARIGAVLVTINPAYRPFELEYVLQQSDAAALFLVDRFKQSDYFEMLAEVCPEIRQPRAGSLATTRFPKLREVISCRGEGPAGMESWSQFLARSAHVSEEELASREAALEARAAINIQYTSGTTGFPKAAMLSHRNLLLNAFYIGEAQRLSSDDRICIPVPFFHCFGCVLGTLACCVYGAAMVIPHEYFRPRETLDALQHEACTSLYGVPTMFIAELADGSFPGRTFPALRTGIMAGAPCPVEVMRQIGEQMNARELTIAYGQTEASPVITQTRTSDPIELRVETVGRPLPGWEVKIVDPATGSELPDLAQGEFCARGHGVMLGYYNNPAATAAAIDSDGWLHTGDLAVRLPNGYFKITGRIKDMVIRGGENIYPREIEEFLYTHPAVEQVSVVGVPDLKYGEELCAWIRLRNGHQLEAEQVREYCRARLAHFKVPRYVRFVECFPQTVTGKIQKFKLREHMIQELGLTEQRTA